MKLKLGKPVSRQVEWQVTLQVRDRVWAQVQRQVLGRVWVQVERQVKEAI